MSTRRCSRDADEPARAPSRGMPPRRHRGAAWTAAILGALMVWAVSGPVAQATQPGWPALHDVVDVAPDDILNVRARPDARAPVIGVLAPDAGGVEVIEADETLRWGRVNAGEASGWASLRYLERRPGQWDGAFPAIAACFGTEPFWTLEVAGDRLEWITPGGRVAGEVSARLGSVARRDRHGLAGSVEGAPLAAVIRGERCGDGMSDRAYGLAFDAILGSVVYSGCCTLAAP